MGAAHAEASTTAEHMYRVIIPNCPVAVFGMCELRQFEVACRSCTATFRASGRRASCGHTWRGACCA